MITLLTGSTGSGKSYRAVHDMLMALSQGKRVFSNIKLNIDDPTYEYIDEIEVAMFLSEIEASFNGTNLEEAKQNYLKSKYANAEIVLDEVQFLGMKTYKKSISDWLTLHRHFNQNVVLITQIIKNLAPVYQDLCHLHIDYVSPYNRLLKTHFQYTEYDGVKGEKTKTRMQKPDQRMFEIYKTGKAESSFHPLLLKLLAIIAAFVFVVFMLLTSDHGLASSVKGDEKKETKKEILETEDAEENNEDIEEYLDENKTVERELKCQMYRERPLNYVWAEKLIGGYYACTNDIVKEK